jgi:hypothetical protein
MAPEPAPDEILEALNRTGFLLEQEVASALQGLGLEVNTGVAYQDPDEGKSREIDVLASSLAHIDPENFILVTYEMICECKNTQWPFVLIGRPRTIDEDDEEPVEYLFPIPKFAVALSDTSDPKRYVLSPTFTILKLHAEHYYFKSPVKAVQVVRMYLKSGKWQADNEGVFDSLIYPLAKALLARKKQLSTAAPPRPGQPSFVSLYFPTVITSGKLYFLDATKQDPMPEEVSHVTLLREIRTQNTSGHFRIDFITREGIEHFVQNKIKPFVNAVVQRVISDPQYFHSSEETAEGPQVEGG